MHGPLLPSSCSRSKTKFDSGSGWPSFFDIIKEGGAGQSVITKTDRSLGMVRTEVLCAKVRDLSL